MAETYANKATMKSKVCDYIRKNGPQRFTDLQRFIHDENHGKGSYDAGRKLRKSYNYEKGDYEMKVTNSNRGYYCCAFYGPRPYFLHGGSEQIFKNDNGLYDVTSPKGRHNKYYQGNATLQLRQRKPFASEIKLPRTEDGVIFAVTGESKNAETLSELMKETNNPKKFNVERVNNDHVKVTLDGGNSFFFPNRQWEYVKTFVLNSHYGSMDQARVRYDEKQKTPIFKAKPGDLLFYIDNNKVCSADLIEIKFRWTKGQKKVTTYTTIHGTYAADRVFTSKEELIKSL